MSSNRPPTELAAHHLAGPDGTAAYDGTRGAVHPSPEGLLALEPLDSGDGRLGAARRLRARLRDGATTTVYAATHDLTRMRVSIERLPWPEPLEAWCRREAVSHAITGGFFVRATGQPLGELRKDGVALESVSFIAPWHRQRACVHVANNTVRLAPRHLMPARPAGDLLQAGPLLVHYGRPCVHGDREGFSSAHHQFDTDITHGRYPRSALALTADDALLAVVCDGRAPHDAGLTLAESADVLVALGAITAINLDGGASAALVCEGRLHNRPRSDDGDVRGGRPVVTAITLRPHQVQREHRTSSGPPDLRPRD